MREFVVAAPGNISPTTKSWFINRVMSRITFIESADSATCKPPPLSVHRNLIIIATKWSTHSVTGGGLPIAKYNPMKIFLIKILPSDYMSPDATIVSLTCMNVICSIRSPIAYLRRFAHMPSIITFLHTTPINTRVFFVTWLFAMQITPMT